MGDKNPNPQGKGDSLVLSALNEQRTELAEVPAKHIEQVTTELFTSLFVLESEFQFKPVQGKVYYLYQQPEKFWLGLTPPSMMDANVAGRFIGQCVLQADMTWTLELADDVASDSSFLAYLEAKRDAFEQRLGAADTVDDVLPVYEKRLSFYSRASAFAVAYSLGRSMTRSGISGLSYDEARGLLTEDNE